MENPVLLNIPKSLRHRLKCLAVKREEPMYETITFCLDFLDATTQFLDTLETVLDLDWEYTKAQLILGDPIPDGQTFLYPSTPIETENWSNYAALRRQYYALRLQLLDGKGAADAPSMA